MTRDIRSLVEVSLLSPLQGESNTMAYSIYSSKLHCCDHSLLVKKCASPRVRRISMSLRRNFDESTMKLRRRRFVVMLRRSRVEILHPYDVSGRRIFDKTATS